MEPSTPSSTSCYVVGEYTSELGDAGTQQSFGLSGDAVRSIQAPAMSAWNELLEDLREFSRQVEKSEPLSDSIHRISNRRLDDFRLLPYSPVPFATSEIEWPGSKEDPSGCLTANGNLLCPSTLDHTQVRLPGQGLPPPAPSREVRNLMLESRPSGGAKNSFVHTSDIESEHVPEGSLLRHPSPSQRKPTDWSVTSVSESMSCESEGLYSLKQNPSIPEHHTSREEDPVGRSTSPLLEEGAALSLRSQNEASVKDSDSRVYGKKAKGRRKYYDSFWKCSECGVDSTPVRRSGPDGPRTLCNACGLRRSKARNKGRRPGIHRPRTNGDGSTWSKPCLASLIDEGLSWPDTPPCTRQGAEEAPSLHLFPDLARSPRCVRGNPGPYFSQWEHVEKPARSQSLE